MVNWLRSSRTAQWILTVVRVWLGVQWALDGWSKITMDGGFSAAGLIQSALKNPVQAPTGPAFPWFTEFLKVTTNNGHSTDVYSFLVAWGELLVGLGLIFGTLTLAAAFFGLTMNFTYLMAGVVSVNPTYILLEFLILIAGFNAAKIGLDYWITPIFRRWRGQKAD